MAKFTKKDLKNGDFVVRRDGKIGVVIVDRDLIVLDDGKWDNISDYTDELCLRSDYNASRWCDIMKVFRNTKSFNLVGKDLDTPIFDRKRDEVEEMTLEEICKALGKNIKIVKGE